MSRAASVGLIVLLIASCDDPAPAPTALVPPIKEIAVGDGACQLTLLPDGRRLLVNNLEEYTLSVVDLAEGREVRRIRLDVAEEHGEYIRSYALGRDGRTVWAACNRGRIFEVDVDTGAATQRFLDREYYFNGIAEDAERNRLILGGEQEATEDIGFFAFALPDGEISWLDRTGYTPDQLRIVGSRLWFLGREPAIFGEGKHDSIIGIFDLARDRIADERSFKRGITYALEIGPAGDFWLTDHGADRLMRLSPVLDHVIVRRMGGFWGWDARGASPMELDLDEHRVYVSGGEKGVLEYERRGDFLSDLPVREYRVTGGEPFEDAVGDVLCLPDGRLLVANRLEGILQVFGPEDGEPFEGFGED
jgi:hypothetical protein